MRTSTGGESSIGRDIWVAKTLALTESEVVQRRSQRIELDVVDREAPHAVIEEHRSQLGEEPHHDRGRIGPVGFDGKPVSGNEAHAIGGSPAHHADEAPAVQRDDTDGIRPPAGPSVLHGSSEGRETSAGSNG